MMEGKVRNRVFVYNAYHRDAQEIMIPNNEPPAIVVPPSGSFTTPAPPRGAAPWPTATQRLFFFFFQGFEYNSGALLGETNF
jgi:hypothetical protein